MNILIKILIIFTIFILNGCTFILISNRNKVIPIETCGDKINPIKTNGYYYSETEIKENLYLKNLNEGGYIEDTTQLISKKIIKPIFLNKNGTVIVYPKFSGLQDNLMFSFLNSCNLKDSNNIDFAKKYFECYYQNNDNKNTIWSKGVFKTTEKEIIIQYYINWIGSYYLVEKTGMILNDSTFILQKQFDYFNKTANVINETYKFQSTKLKPDSLNYILKHKRLFGN